MTPPPDLSSGGAAKTSGGEIAAMLPPLRGRVTLGAPLGPRSWFRVGGPAEVLVQPADAEDLAAFLGALPLEIPVLTIGAASNLIIRDGGIPGVVIRLARGFTDIAVEEDGLVAGAACLDMTIAETAAEAGLAGLEFLAGIPGSLGGAVAMNAGAYDSDTAAVLDWAEIVTRDGTLVRVENARLRFGYRHSALPPGAVVVRARLRAIPAPRAQVAARIAEIRAAREASQPVRARTGGSTFRNPEGRRAWQLIDEAGCRGLVLGGAQVSDKHCNFLLNTGAATADDLERLGEAVRTRVRAATGVTLEWEIKRLGRPAPDPNP